MLAGRVAVIGLGIMGSRMARRLIEHGFEVAGYDPAPDRMDEFVAMGGTSAGSPTEAVAGCWAALLSLLTSDISREVCLGSEGISSAAAPGLLVYDATTGRPSDAVEIGAALADHDIIYCDSTVSGNGAVAEQGGLVVMVGGPEDAYRRGIPIFEAIGRAHHHVGEIGSGSLMKLLVNHALMIHRMALAETLVVAELAGLDLDAALDILKDGLSYSKAMDVWGERMIEGDHDIPHARLRQSSKDARLIVENAVALGAPIGLAEVVAAALAEGEATGLSDYDNSSIIEVVRRRAGIGRVK